MKQTHIKGEAGASKSSPNSSFSVFMRLPDNEDLALPTPSFSPLHSAAPTVAKLQAFTGCKNADTGEEKELLRVPRRCPSRETVSALHSPSQPFPSLIRWISQAHISK